MPSLPPERLEVNESTVIDGVINITLDNARTAERFPDLATQIALQDVFCIYVCGILITRMCCGSIRTVGVPSMGTRQTSTSTRHVDSTWYEGEREFATPSIHTKPCLWVDNRLHYHIPERSHSFVLQALHLAFFDEQDAMNARHRICFLSPNTCKRVTVAWKSAV